MKGSDVTLLGAPAIVRLYDEASTTSTACCGFLQYALWIPLSHVTTKLSPHIQSVSGSKFEKDIYIKCNTRGPVWVLILSYFTEDADLAENTQQQGAQLIFSLLLTFKYIFTETARDYRLPPRCEIFALHGLWNGSYLPKFRHNYSVSLQRTLQ